MFPFLKLRLSFHQKISIALWVSFLLVGFVVAVIASFMFREAFIQRAFDLLEITHRSARSSIQSMALESVPKHFFLDRTGLGLTGETYLMDENGALLTESRFQASEIQNLAHPFVGDSSEWSGMKRDYRGKEVFSRWSRLDGAGKKYFLVSEIDESEVLGPYHQFLYKLVWVLGVMFILSTLVTPLLSRWFFRGLENERSIMRLRNLSLIEGADHERNQIAMELHDDLGPLLVALRYQRNSQDQFDKIFCLINEKMRFFNRSLSISAVERYGVIEAMRDFASHFEHRVSVDFQMNEIPKRLHRVLYRVFCEGLKNALVHGQENSKITVRMYPETSTRKIFLRIENSVSHPPKQVMSSGLGLQSLKLRVESEQGELSWSESSDEVFVLVAEFRVHQNEFEEKV